MTTKQNVRNLKSVTTKATDDAEALGLETWQPWVKDEDASLCTVLLRTLVDTNADVVGGALDLLEQDLDLLALAAESADDPSFLGYAILRASRRVATINELRRRIGEGRLSVDAAAESPPQPGPRRTGRR